MQTTIEEMEKLTVSNAVNALVLAMETRPEDFTVSIELNAWYKVTDSVKGVSGSVWFSKSNSFGVVEAYSIGGYAFMNINEIAVVHQAAKDLSRFKSVEYAGDAKIQFEAAYNQI